MNKNWKEIWKELANSKQNLALHHFQYCVLKALFAKNNAKKEVAQALLRRAFTPKDGYDWSTVDRLVRVAYNSSHIFNQNIDNFLDEAEKVQYKELIASLGNVGASEPDYMFIFVRQDISPEQQAVQAAHATYCAGAKFQPKDAEQTYFVLIGVEDEEALKQIAEGFDSRKLDYVSFVEPDLSHTVTAIATERMKESQKRFLRKFKKLVF